MCGIAAIVTYRDSSRTVRRDELQRMTDAMERRGPDGEGHWLDERGIAALGHRRLSIIELSDLGAQPMVMHGGRYVITFNGEIYNYAALREQLVREGAVFQSHSDTEVLLQMYARKGVAMLDELRGMFAFVIWDTEKKEAFIARDPYGIKPLYYANNGDTVRLASQVKSILAGGNVSAAIDPAGKAGFYLTGSVPEPFTYYRYIKALPAGSWMKIGNGRVEGPVSWFSIARVFSGARSAAPLSRDEYFETVRSELNASVKYHMVADVPVGAFLSAGIDSTSLVGIMRDTGVEDIRTMTLAFDEFKDGALDEAPLAEEVAQLYRTTHSVRHLASEEFRADLPHFLDAMDQPTIDGLNSYFVSKAAAELGLKVVLSGLGGDELFGGYNTFTDVPDWVRKFRIPAGVPLLGRAFRGIYNAFIAGSSSRSPKVASALEYGGSWGGAYYLRRGVFLPWELESVMKKDEAEEGLRQLTLLDRMQESLEPDPGSDFGRIATLESVWYMRNQLLRDTDWAGMAHSLEVRVPLVDAWLLKALAPYTPQYGNAYKKKPVMDSPKTALPDGVRNKPKTGFFVPVQQWLETEPSVDAWRSNSALCGDGTPWARRWAYTVAQMTEARLVN